MFYFISLLFTLFISQLALTAPTPPLDPKTLLKNGQDAQSLNTQFNVLKSTDPCSSGQTACIAGALAQCQSNAWATTECPATQKCFALPSVRDSGTFVTCTSEASALSLINATGATGGLTSTSANNVPFPTSSSSTAGTGAPSDNSTVTVTVTLSPTPSPDAAPGAFTTTLPTETHTLSPAEASSLLASLASAESSSSCSSNASLPTPASGAASGPGTTIFLNGPSATGGAAPATSPPSTTPSPTGGYGY